MVSEDETFDLAVRAALRGELTGYAGRRVEASGLKSLWLGYILTRVLVNNPLSGL